MSRRAKVVGITLVALVAAATIGFVVWAQTTSSSSQTFLGRVAAKLGVTEDALIQAMYEARSEMIDEAVAAGELTQAQADYLKAQLKAQLEYYKAEGYQKGDPWGFGPKMGRFGFRGGFRGFGSWGGCPCWGTSSTSTSSSK
ncbi:DUF2680 domain-containing protein [Candidatus Bipolaricaulota bacterium]|nr:DUF2680 domain-containing protein [Candidatus Bipolaricaulota bacterium]